MRRFRFFGGQCRNAFSRAHTFISKHSSILYSVQLPRTTYSVNVFILHIFPISNSSLVSRMSLSPVHGAVSVFFVMFAVSFSCLFVLFSCLCFLHSMSPVLYSCSVSVCCICLLSLYPNLSSVLASCSPSHHSKSIPCLCSCLCFLSLSTVSVSYLYILVLPVSCLCFLSLFPVSVFCLCFLCNLS